MVLTMQVRFLYCIILSTCHGFLLTNKTGIPSGGTNGLTDGHYIILTDALSVQKQLLSQMETFVLQLQNQLKAVNQEVKDLKSGNNATQSLAVAALKHEIVTQSRVVAKLENESIAQSLAVADLKNEFKEKSTRLQNSYDILQKKFDSLQKENNVLEHDNAALKSQIADYHNISIHTKQELDFFTHSIAASNIQNVTTIQSSVETLKFQMKTLNTRLYSLSSTSTSRSQDFLALLNKTNVADLKLENIDNWSKSFQNYTENKLFGLDSFVQNYALDNTTTTNRLYSLEQNYALFSKEIGTVKGKIQELDQHVALTSCGKTNTDYSGGHTMKFPSIKTSVGINNIAEFEKTGQFTCSKSGVYLFSVFVTRVSSNNAEFGLYRNGQLISYVMIEYGASGSHFSGSGTVVVQITAGDILSANAVSSFRVHGSYSCCTVIKIN